MEGVLGVLVPVISVAGFFAWLLARSPVGRAYADRVRAGGGPRAGVDRAGQAQLVEAVDALRREVSELSERMDFAERLLARGERDPARLGPRGPGA